MSLNSRKPAILLLQDGTVFEGTSLGKIGTATGEICYNTGMTGYQEIYTDPSYFGQIIINTSSHIGNYGTVDEEQESSNPQINGVIINEYSEVYSRSNSNESLEDYFIKNNTVAIYDIDTRKLVKYIRDKGAMNSIISSDVLDVDKLKKKLSDVPPMKNLELSSKVTTKSEYTYGNKNSKIKIAVLDLGCKKSILENFSSRGALCKVYPAKTSFSNMDWDFTENIAFKSLYDAFKESEENSALEFLSSDGASYYLELTQDAAGEGLDLGDNETMEELQEEIIEYLENN